MRKTFLEKCINLRLCRVALVLLFLVPAISSLQANPSQNKTILFTICVYPCMIFITFVLTFFSE